MNIKNKLIPIILFTMAICIAVYYYMAFSSVVVFGEELLSNLDNTDYCLPMHLIFIFISFFTIFIILGILQNKICNFIQPRKIQPKKLTLISDSTNNKI